MNAIVFFVKQTLLAPMIHDPRFSPQVLHTWMQLASLGWSGDHRLSTSLHSLENITGKSRWTLARHVKQLQAAGVLALRSDHHGGVMITFNAEKQPEQKIKQFALTARAANASQCSQPESQVLSSYFPDRILGYVSYQSEDD